MAEVDVELDNLLSNFKLDKGVEDLTLDELLANLNTDVDIDEIEEISRVLGETKFKVLIWNYDHLKIVSCLE